MVERRGEADCREPWEGVFGVSFASAAKSDVAASVVLFQIVVAPGPLFEQEWAGCAR